MVKFSATEPQLRRMVTEYNSPVSDDSSVELFLQRADEEEYFNIGCSASTAMLVARGSERGDLKMFDPSLFYGIEQKLLCRH